MYQETKSPKNWLALIAFSAMISFCHSSLAAQGAAKPLTLFSSTSGSPARVSAQSPLTLARKDGALDLSPYDSVYIQVRNPGQQAVTVWARADNPEAKGIMDSVRTAVVLEPGQTQTVRLRLMRRPQDPTYAPFKPFFMYTKNLNVRDGTIDPSKVARVVVWLESATGGQFAVVESITASGAGAAGPVAFSPWVDKYGQYAHADWPDKIYGDSDFVARLQKEQNEMSAYPGAPDWDQYGGWKNGPKQEATGFFYPKKVDGKWWLVNPLGNLFWSYGPTGVGAGGEGSPVTGKEKWFTELPPQVGPFAKYWGEGKGARYMYYSDEGGRPWKSYNFGTSNTERKYGPNWREATADFLHARLRNWGFNTIANWSDSAVYLKQKTPYVVAIHYGGPKLEHIPDVFDSGFEKALRERMEQEKGATAGDPWNIGYFVDNELAWSYMNGAEGAIRGALRAEATSATKQALITDLTGKYSDIAALNAAWGTNYVSWEAMLSGRVLPDAKNDKARSADLAAFGYKFVEKYFSTVRAVVRDVAPNNLYLGVRFHGHIDTAIVEIAAQYADVISWNVYEEPGSRLNRFVNVIDKPFIVGEFGIGSDVMQTPFRGDVLSEDPMARVRAMENWVRRAVVHPLIVGGHYFQFRDQPITGRADGEAVLRGFVNIADTPHFELVQANRSLGYNLYATRSTGQALGAGQVPGAGQVGMGQTSTEPAPGEWSKQPIRGLVGVGTQATVAEFKDIKITKENRTLYASDFSKGTPGLKSWNFRGGKWEVVDGALRQSTLDAGPHALIGHPNWSDYTLTLKARKISGNGGFLIFFGSSGREINARWTLGGGGNTKTTLEIPGGAPSQMDMRIEPGRWYDIKIEVQGPSVKAYLDGRLVQQTLR